ncbi:MAG TPA: type I polyketide synthase, partial [Vicinamibacterales bacterium]|nr:type I polyketide synthase [Vicinamibacterales bacterium]
MSAPDRRDLLKNAVAAVEEMRARVQAAERAITEPIAIVGIGCRMPGGVTTPDELWTLLAEGRDAITEVPPGRWSAELYEAMAPEVAASAPRPRAGFVDGLDQFDPHFFSISPREAASMDPQHRMVLEASWQALEHASIAPDRLRGSLTGVFVGITAIDYAMHVRFAEASRLDVYTATGSAHNAAAGRISYVLGLQGPSMAIDTACSSSLAAVHLACQSLRLRECNLALAGGVNTIVIPDWFVSMTRWGMLAPDGRCKAFDRDADGMVRAEGCGIVALKRLSDAEADGDRILAVVLGSAVNQDGASGGLTVPNGRAQAAVIRQALRAARVAPADVSYVEAHGTGTTLGDPIELEALDEVMSEGRASSSPMVVGSIKTNLGHLEAAAGIAGLIKVVLSLQHEMIPRNLHFTELNPAITLRSLPVTIPRDTVRWPRQQAPRIAGVSSFGLSGTNAHVVLREAPPRASAPSTRDVHLLTLSARSDAALRRQAARWRDRLMAEPALHPGDVAHAANTGRAALPHRATIIASGTAEFASKLNDIATGAPTSGTSLAHAPRQQRPRVAMMFTGQGSQYAGMGRELHASQPVFRGALDRCSDILQPILGLSLAELVLQDPRGLIDQTAYTQPALFAVEYALYETWRSWGISPAAVLGHSVGEYVAACIAGVFSLEDGLRLIAERGRLMQQLPAGGTMAAVLAPESAVRATLDTHARDVSIAAVNGPDSIVISGPASSVASAIEAFEAAGFGCRLLQVSHAFHSSLMDPVLTAFGDAARAVTYHPPSLPLVSNVSGDFFADGEAPAAGYWTNHLRNAVRFGDGVATLERAGYNVVLEVGPAPALTNMARRVVSATSTTLISSLRRDQGNWAAMLSAAGALFRSGATVDWDAVDRGLGYAPVSLPTYPFERERYWIEAGVSSSVAVTARIEEAATSTVAGEQLPTTVLYEVDWQSLTIAVTDPAMREGSWIVVGNPGKVANAVVDQLRSSGARAAVLPVGGWHAIKPAIESGAAPRRVVITTGCDAGDVDGTDASALRASIRAACDPILQVTQALLRDSVAAQIVILTSNAQAPAGAASVDVAHASVWGLGRALRIEHPELQCKLIDVRLDVPIDATAI